MTDDLITVMQLGGEYKGVETPFAKELPALQVDGMYYLFLQSTDGGRSDYYISGAGQGWFSIDSREEYVVKDELKDMVSMVFEERKANDALQRTLATPLNGRRLTANPTYYFFDNTVPSDTNIRNAIRRGMQAWNPYMSIQVVEGYASSLNIRIYVSYENNGLAGWANYENNYLYIYPAGFNTAIDYNWEKVACHEMGHYIGLAHNTNGESTMHPSHENQPGYPQYPDILALSEIYP